jgi:hypothetical protein
MVVSAPGHVMESDHSWRIKTKDSDDCNAVQCIIKEDDNYHDTLKKAFPSWFTQRFSQSWSVQEIGGKEEHRFACCCIVAVMNT